MIVDHEDFSIMSQEAPEVRSPARRGHKPELGSSEAEALFRGMCADGMTLRQMQSRLALPSPEGLGVSVSVQSIAYRLQRLGLKLKAKQFGADKPVPDEAALAAMRRETSPKDIREALASMRPKRAKSWLKTFDAEIKDLYNRNLSYVEIWDCLAIKYRSVVPQFAQQLSDSQKKSKLSVFIHRERQRLKRLGRTRNWANAQAVTREPIQSPAENDRPGEQEVKYEATNQLPAKSIPIQRPGAALPSLGVERRPSNRMGPIPTDTTGLAQERLNVLQAQSRRATPEQLEAIRAVEAQKQRPQ